MMVGKQYGLEPSDLWKATRQINLPEVIKEASTDCNTPNQSSHSNSFLNSREISRTLDSMDSLQTHSRRPG